MQADFNLTHLHIKLNTDQHWSIKPHWFDDVIITGSEWDELHYACSIMNHVSQKNLKVSRVFTIERMSNLTHISFIHKLIHWLRWSMGKEWDRHNYNFAVYAQARHSHSKLNKACIRQRI
jgi:hypothetical protein